MADADRIVHPNALPNYEEAVILREKLEGYSLNLEHPVGKHHAIVFKSALGFEHANWQLLESALLIELPYHNAGAVKRGPWGEKYILVFPIIGPNGNTVEVLSVWIIRPGTDFPSLVTTYVA